MASFKVYYDEKQECVIASLEGKAGFEMLKKYAKKYCRQGINISVRPYLMTSGRKNQLFP